MGWPLRVLSSELWDCIIDSDAFVTQFENNGIVVAQRRAGRDDDLACR